MADAKNARVRSAAMTATTLALASFASAATAQESAVKNAPARAASFDVAQAAAPAAKTEEEAKEPRGKGGRGKEGGPSPRRDADPRGGPRQQQGGPPPQRQPRTAPPQQNATPPQPQGTTPRARPAAQPPPRPPAAPPAPRAAPPAPVQQQQPGANRPERQEPRQESRPDSRFDRSKPGDFRGGPPAAAPGGGAAARPVPAQAPGQQPAAAESAPRGERGFFKRRKTVAPSSTPAAQPRGSAVPAGAARPPAAAQAPRIDNIRGTRRESREADGRRTVIREADNRVIVRQDNRVMILNDNNRRFQRFDPNARQIRRGDGTIETVARRPGGVEVRTVTNSNGHLIRRYRRDPSGREITLVDNRQRDKLGRRIAIGAGIGLGVGIGALIARSFVDLPPPRVSIPRNKYIVEYEHASEEDVYEALSAPPIEHLDRDFTLDEVLHSPRLRERMRRIDLSDIRFEFGAWDVDESQYGKLARIADAMLRVIDRNPAEMFLIEGHTDLVGSEEDNLSLSDRRAESVANILTEEFDVPPENLATQGYGEAYPKVETEAPEALNRRVAVRRITPLLSREWDR